MHEGPLRTNVKSVKTVPCLGPRSTRSCGGAQTLEGAAREWDKFRLELKRAIAGYATDVFVMLELKTKPGLSYAT